MAGGNREHMNNLRKYRAEKGLTLEELGAKIGTTRQRAFSCEKHLSVNIAKKCAIILDENVFEILGTDVLKILPKTQEEKDSLLEAIAKIEVK